MQEQNGKKTYKPKSKEKRKPALNCSQVCAYHCAQLSYTIQRRKVLIIFFLILQTIIIVQMLPTGGEGDAGASRRHGLDMSIRGRS